MLRATTAFLVTIGVALMVTASGCTEAEDTIVVPRDDPVRPPPWSCDDYVPGLVGAVFDDEAPFVDIDILVRSFDLVYRYWSRGEVQIRATVEEGDARDLRDRVLASPLVERVYLGHQTYPDERSFLKITFVVGVPLDDARTLIASYPELAITHSWRNPIHAEFEVPVGDEDEWIDRFLEEDLIIDARNVAVACPTLE